MDAILYEHCLNGIGYDVKLSDNFQEVMKEEIDERDSDWLAMAQAACDAVEFKVDKDMPSEWKHEYYLRLYLKRVNGADASIIRHVIENGLLHSKINIIDITANEKSALIVRSAWLSLLPCFKQILGA